MAEAVLAGARPVAPGVPVPTLAHDFTYTWLFYWLNGSPIPAGHLRHFEQQPRAEQQALLDGLRRDYGLSFRSLAEAASTTRVCKRPWSGACGASPSQPAGAPAGQRAVRLRAGSTAGRSFLGPAGMLITFSGVDGAGKSTVIEHVQGAAGKDSGASGWW